MTEERISFLFKLSTLRNQEPSIINKKMKSYYLMRCHSLTSENNLPAKQFSSNQRCAHCCSEWTLGSYTSTTKPLKLSKNQRRKIKHNDSKKELLHCTQLERVCLLCKKTTILTAAKPQKENKPLVVNDGSKFKETTSNKVLKAKTPAPVMKCNEQLTVNVYSQSKDVFALGNKHNTLQTAIKTIQKPIKNNKKKKDKFAGLCQAAVLASAKIAQEKPNHNKKLDLFLRKSS